MTVDSRSILAANLKALMRERLNLNTFPKIVKAGGPTNGTLDRIRRCESGASVDQIDLLAKVFEIEPWMLLVPGLDAKARPQEPLGYSAEAQALGWLLDQIKDRLDKKVADHAATEAILTVLQKTGEAPTHTPAGRVNPAKSNG